MMARDAHPRDQPIPPDLPSTVGTGLTSDERQAIQAAAKEEGYSESFADLLCRFAELIGTEEVLGELKKLDAKDPES
jgi:hypothetical protein